MTGASRFLIGLVTCFATHDGVPAAAHAASGTIVFDAGLTENEP
ncbi:hypothetical protein [Pseudarthrobacter sp. H2]